MNITDTTPYWDLACLLSVERSSPAPLGIAFYETAIIDPGINFFVLALEELGATTHYSCEGHPDGAYVFLKAPATLAKELYLTATFYYFGPLMDGNAEIEFGLYAREPMSPYYLTTEEQRLHFLRTTASKWMSMFYHRLPKLRQQLKDKEADYIRNALQRSH